MDYEVSQAKEEIFEKFFLDPNKIFPFMVFREHQGKWVSKIHYNDEQRDRSGQDVSFIYPNNKGYITDHARGSIGIIDLYMERNGIDFPEAMDRLRDEYFLPPFRGDRTECNRHYDKLRNMKIAQEAFSAALWGDTEEAKAARDYMTNVRKWSEEEIKKAGLGLITDEIKDTLPDKTPFYAGTSEGNIGTAYTLTIPARVGADIMGFTVRTINPEIKTRYCDTKDLHKGDFLFGIGCGMETITIVEGPLDALRAKVNGYTNIVATMGSGLKIRQAEDAKKRGVRNVILLFDNDAPGREFVLKIDEKGQETGSICIAEAQGFHVFIAELPEEVKDVDEFLNTWSADDLRKITTKASPSRIYRADLLFKKYKAIEDKQGELNAIDRENIKYEFEKIVLSGRPEDKPLLLQYFSPYAEALGISMEDFEARINSNYFAKREKEKTLSVHEAVVNMGRALENGDTDRAVRLMGDTAEKVRITHREEEFTKVFAPILSKEEIFDIFSNFPDSIPTGYVFKEGSRKEALTLNVGLTFICGNRGHGKTTFLNNIALNEAGRQYLLSKDGSAPKSVLYFSYEIDKRRLIATLLNTFVNNKEITLKAIYKYLKGGGREGLTDELYEEFTEKFNLFLEYLRTNILTIVTEPYKVETLQDAIKYYLHSGRRPSLICIDYAQQIYSECARFKSRTEEIKMVVNELKNLANKENIPFVLAAQFNREVSSPISVDTKNIGEGGDFERIADTCIGLFNLKELHALQGQEQAELTKMLTNLLPGVFKGDIGPIEGKIFARLLKRRYGYFPLNTCLDWTQETGFIKTNDSPTTPDNLQMIIDF